MAEAQPAFQPRDAGEVQGGLLLQEGVDERRLAGGVGWVQEVEDLRPHHAPRIPVVPYEEVRRQAIARNQRNLQPEVLRFSRAWPIPAQPSPRELRELRSGWGGDLSVVAQAVPGIGADYYQFPTAQAACKC